MKRNRIVSVFLVGALTLGLTRTSYMSLYASDTKTSKETTKQSKTKKEEKVEVPSYIVDQTKSEDTESDGIKKLDEILNPSTPKPSEKGEEENKLSYDELMTKYVELSLQSNYYDKTMMTYEENAEAMYEKMDKMQEKITKLEAKLSDKKAKEEIAKRTVYLDPYDVRVKSGASVEQLNAMLKGTWLEGYGQVYHDYEEKFGINALFSIGNAILETGWDINESYLGSTHNNIYGIAVDTYFESKEACIDFWYNLISEHYIGESRYSMWNINSKYCPPNNLWADCIINVVHRLVSNAGLTIG